MTETALVDGIDNATVIGGAFDRFDVLLGYDQCRWLYPCNVFLIADSKNQPFRPNP
jgi:hypothetical protein